MVEIGTAAVAVACSQVCITGEAPVWDHRIGRLHWVDVRGKAVLTLDPVSGITQRVPTGDLTGFVALTADPGVVVVGLRSRLAHVTLATGATAAIVDVEADLTNNRINDGTVAPDGAIIFGTLDTEYTTPSGTFWRYKEGVLSPLGGAMIVTNGPGFSADGASALTVDTMGRQIYRQSYSGGRFVPAGDFATFPLGQGLPDGVTFDAEGFAWVAHYGGGRLSRFRTDGTVERSIAVPASQVTNCAFGGADLRTLYITTAAFRRPLADEPLAGCLFSVPVDTPGLPASIAAL